MKTKLLAAAALATVFAASGASAQAIGWYGAVDIGGHFPQDIRANSSATLPGSSSTAAWKWRPDAGFIGDLRLGYQFTPHWRGEAEVSYRDSKLKSVGGNGGVPQGLTNVGGTVNDWSYMANVIYDFTPGAKINPFLGLGLGATQLNVKSHGTFNAVPAGFTANGGALRECGRYQHGFLGMVFVGDGRHRARGARAGSGKRKIID